MPYSHPAHYTAVVNLIKENFKPKTTRIIDIGVGSGVYRELLSEYEMDGIEIYEKYIGDFNLIERYDEIFNVDAITFDYTKKYKLAILGDVLEHMSVEDAKTVLTALKKAGISIVAQIPYEYEQGVYDGNEHEIHLQPDLTPDIFMERYAEFGFELLQSDEVCGAYYSFKKGKA